MLRRFGNIIDAVATVAKVLRVSSRRQVRTRSSQRQTLADPSDCSGQPTSAAPRFRGLHHRYDLTACLACERCARNCAGGCIHVGKERVPGRSGFQITSFTIDYERCLVCGLCTELCPAGCLVMGCSRELSRCVREGRMVDFSRLPVEAAWGPSTFDPLAATRRADVTPALQRESHPNGGKNG